jgi:radical SAM protein with 4Fe4S-binding SPASM domain
VGPELLAELIGAKGKQLASHIAGKVGQWQDDPFHKNVEPQVVETRPVRPARSSTCSPRARSPSARTSCSPPAPRSPQHDPAEFVVGNIFTHADIAARLDAYRFHDRYQVGDNPTCGSCALSDGCGKGCPAAVISAGGRIGDVDADQCPVTTSERRLLPLIPA